MGSVILFEFLGLEDWGLARQVDAEALYRLALAIRFPSYHQTPNPGPSGGDAD